MTNAAFRIVRADWSRDRERLVAVRTAVFVEEQGVPVGVELDGRDGACDHVLALAGAMPVGAGRLTPGGKIGRLAVLADWRGRGVGSALLRELLAVAAQSGLGAVYLHAQVGALRFYEGFGFRAEGPVFDEADIPHRRMTLSLG